MGKSSVRKGFLTLTLGQGLSILAGYVTHVGLARSLGAAEYGEYGVILYVLSTVTLVLTAGLPEAIAKFAAEDEARSEATIRRGAGLQFRLSLGIAAFYALISPLLARVLNDRSLTPYLALSALSIPAAGAYAVAVGALSGQRRFGLQALLVGGYGVVRLVLILGLAQLYRVMGAVIGFILAPLLVIIPFLPRLLFHPVEKGEVHLRQLWAFAKPVIVFSVALALLMNLDVFAVKALTEDPDEIGHYLSAATIGRVPYFAFSSLGVVLLPVVASSENQEHIRALVQNAMRVMLLGSLLAVAVIVPLSPAILRLLYGAEFSSAAPELALLSVSGTLLTLFFTLAYALNGRGEPRIAMRLAVIGVLVEGVLVTLLTRAFGTFGAAFASCITAGGTLLASIQLSRPYFGVILSKSTLLRATLAVVLTSAAGYLLPRQAPLDLLMAAPLAVLYVTLLLATREISVSQLREVLGQWKRPNAVNDGC